jgi:hypothetical protein
MVDKFELDGRVLNSYKIADLEQSHPAVFAAFQGWFDAVRELDQRPSGG